MTTNEVRAIVTAYQSAKDLLEEPLPDGIKQRLASFLDDIEFHCRSITGNSAPSRWARSMVGPVLAAAMGSATYMREDVPNAGAALRIFGLAGERALTSQAAWRIVEPYAWEPVLSPRVLKDIKIETQLRLGKLPVEPTPIDVLIELTRPRSSAFCVQIARWLAEYFREHALDDSPYAAAYRKSLDGLMSLNEKGEMAALIEHSPPHRPLGRAEWEALIDGRVPHYNLEIRAGYLTARQFVLAYWEKWQVNPLPKAVAG